MTATALHDSQSRLLGFLTIAVAQCLGDAAKMMLEEDNGVRKLQMERVDEIVCSSTIRPTPPGRAASIATSSTCRNSLPATG
jgi:hypothetical protein